MIEAFLPLPDADADRQFATPHGAINVLPLRTLVELDQNNYLDPEKRGPLWLPEGILPERAVLYAERQWRRRVERAEASHMDPETYIGDLATREHVAVSSVDKTPSPVLTLVPEAAPEEDDHAVDKSDNNADDPAEEVATESVDTPAETQAAPKPLRTRQSREPGDDEIPDLVERAKEGDRGAFDSIVRLTYKEIYTLAYRLTGNKEDARDTVQESFLRAYRGLKRFRGDAQFSTWMYRITANCASTYLGKRGRHRHEELSDDLPLDQDRPAGNPEANLDARARSESLQEALRRLPPRLRAVVVLRDVYDLTHESIAAELGISVSAAKVRLHRARRKLREDLYPLPGDGDSPENPENQE